MPIETRQSRSHTSCRVSKNKRTAVYRVVRNNTSARAWDKDLHWFISLNLYGCKVASQSFSLHHWAPGKIGWHMNNHRILQRMQVTQNSANPFAIGGCCQHSCDQCCIEWKIADSTLLLQKGHAKRHCVSVPSKHWHYWHYCLIQSMRCQCWCRAGEHVSRFECFVWRFRCSRCKSFRPTAQTRDPHANADGNACSCTRVWGLGPWDGYSDNNENSS